MSSQVGITTAKLLSHISKPTFNIATSVNLFNTYELLELLRQSVAYRRRCYNEDYYTLINTDNILTWGYSYENEPLDTEYSGGVPTNSAFWYTLQRSIYTLQFSTVRSELPEDLSGLGEYDVNYTSSVNLWETVGEPLYTSPTDNGWRRVTEYDEEGNPVFTRGYFQEGDKVGKWLWEDIFAALGVMTRFRGETEGVAPYYSLSGYATYEYSSTQSCEMTQEYVQNFSQWLWTASGVCQPWTPVSSEEANVGIAWGNRGAISGVGSYDNTTLWASSDVNVTSSMSADPHFPPTPPDVEPPAYTVIVEPYTTYWTETYNCSISEYKRSVNLLPANVEAEVMQDWQLYSSDFVASNTEVSAIGVNAYEDLLYLQKQKADITSPYTNTPPSIAPVTESGPSVRVFMDVAIITCKAPEIPEKYLP